MRERVRILCVDDEPGVRRAVERLLLDENWEILSASSGPEGLEVLERAGVVHAVLADYRMPGMNGAEFLREVRRRRPEAVRILFSGYADAAALAAAINEGRVFRFVPKPWDDEELRAALAEAVAHHFVLRRCLAAEGAAVPAAAAEGGRNPGAGEAPSAPAAGTLEPEGGGTEPVRVLFVDDEEHVLAALRRMCFDEAFEVLTASSGEAGLDVLRRTPGVGVIVTDQRMPGMTGAEFLREARRIAPHAVRIVLTGYADLEAAVAAVNEGGASRYVAKPWNDEELLATLRDAAARFALESENRRLAALVARQNEELKEWNAALEGRVREQTATIRAQNEELAAAHARLRASFDATLATFVGLMELRDRRTADHGRMVAAAAEAGARAAGLSDREAAAVRIAGLLHDIGKIGVPDVILVKPPDRMSGEEWETYAAHPVRGQTAVDGVEELREAGGAIRYHHERFDGRGFPDGLKGGAIPLGARLVALADFLDHAVAAAAGDDAADRAVDAALREAGTRFDPGLFPDAARAMAAVLRARLPKVGAVERELSAEDLREGMVLSRDVRSGTGVLLLRAGTRLSASGVAALRRRHALDPWAGGVFVLAGEGAS